MKAPCCHFSCRENRRWLGLGAAMMFSVAASTASAAPPALDVIGFQPGMTLDQAVAKLKTAAPNVTVQIINTTIPELGPQFPWMAVGKTPDGNLGLTFEQIAVTVTMPPNAPATVWGVDRSVRYGQGKEPTMADTIAGLHAKYGPEMLNYTQKQFFWGWDERGAPYPVATMRQCAMFAGMDHMTRVTDTIYRPNMLNAQQQQCQKGKFIAANLNPAGNPSLVASMDVAVTDAALESDAMARTRAARTTAQGNAAASQVQRAKQNKPRF